jgi:TonB family protein
VFSFSVPTFRIVGFLGLALALVSSLPAQHVAYISQGNQAHLVRDVQRTTPYLSIDGKLEASSMGGAIHLRPAEFYVAALVQVKELATHFLTTRPESVNKMLKGFTFRAGFLSSAPVDRVYLLIGIANKNGTVQLFFHEIGMLQPGKISYLSFDHDLAQDFEYASYRVYLFSNGAELLHSEMPPSAIEAGESKLIAKEIQGSPDRGPIKLIAPLPLYPAELQKSERIPGSASVAFTISADGKVENPNVVESSQPAFGEAALQTLKWWRFVPAVKNGRPVASAARLPFNFTP